MIVGYILIGAMAGFAAFLAALVSGATIWSALVLYSLVGALGVIALPLMRLALAMFEDDSQAEGVSADSAPAELPDTQAGASPSSLASAGRVWHEDHDVAPTETDASHETTMRILAVDDDPFILELIPIISASAGFSDVTTVSSGQGALEAMASADQGFDCLLVDINMPNMDGIELCERVRKLPGYRHIPIIMLTAMRDVRYMDRAFRAGATDYAAKPFEIAELAARLRFAHKKTIARNRAAECAKVKINNIDALASEQAVSLIEKDCIDNLNGLTNHTALGNYLTQLPREQLALTEVVSIMIEKVDEIYANATAEELRNVLHDVVMAIQQTFVGQMIAYAGDGMFLVISEATSVNTTRLEAAITARIGARTFESDDLDFSNIEIAIGDPVTPLETHAKRSDLTFDRAVTQAKNRFYEKHRALISKHNQ